VERLGTVSRKIPQFFAVKGSTNTSAKLSRVPLRQRRENQGKSSKFRAPARAAYQTGVSLRLRRRASQPSPAKPVSVIAQVAGSGTTEVCETVNSKLRAPFVEVFVPTFSKVPGAYP
jgi:hypothetical protein